MYISKLIGAISWYFVQLVVGKIQQPLTHFDPNFLEHTANYDPPDGDDMCGCGAPLIIMKIMQIDKPMVLMMMIECLVTMMTLVMMMALVMAMTLVMTMALVMTMILVMTMTLVMTMA